MQIPGTVSTVCDAGKIVQTVSEGYRTFLDSQLKQGVNEKSLAKSLLQATSLGLREVSGVV